MIGSVDPQGYPNAEREQYGHRPHLHRHFPALGNQSGHGCGRLLVGDAKVKMQDHILHVVQVLNVDRFVEAVLAENVFFGCRRQGSFGFVKGAAGHLVHEEEGDNGNDK